MIQLCTYTYVQCIVYRATFLWYVDDLNEIRYKITSLVLQYCVENIQDGWKVWVKISAWLYIHVSVLLMVVRMLLYVH